MKLPKIKITKGTLVTIGFAVVAAISAFADEIEKHTQEKRIEELERKVASLEKGDE